MPSPRRTGSYSSRRRVAVVDQEEDAASEAARDIGQPWVDGEGDLGPLALGEDDALGLEPGGERRRRRVRLDVRERSAARPDQDLAQDAAAHHDPMGREGVEDLVREDEADDRRVAVARWGIERVAVTGRLEPGANRLDPARLDLDRLIADDGGKLRSFAREAIEDRRGERPGPRPVLAEDERVRPAEPVPRVGDGPCERGAEDRMRLGRGQEVAVAAGSGGLVAVVAAIRVVQGEVHEPREGDRPVPRDLLVDPRDEGLVLADRVEVGRGVAAEARGHLHGAVRGGPPTTSRTPGPTSVWPPSRIGIGAAAADAVSSRSHGSAIPSARSRSEANRSSAAGQAASSAPRRCASRTRVSTIAASANRARWPPSDPGPSRSRSAPRTDAGGARGAGVRRARIGRLRQPRRRPEPALLDPGPGPGGRMPLQPGERGGGRPSGDEQLGAPVGGDLADLEQAGSRGRRAGLGGQVVGPHAEQDEVERPIEIEAEAPAAAEVVHPVARDLLEPAGQGVVAGECRDGRERVGARDGDDVGRIAVVGQGLAALAGRRGDEGSPIRLGRQRDRPGSEDDQAPGRRRSG